MYFDTALVSGEYALKPWQYFAGSKHIVFGSDFCIAKIAPVIIKNLGKDGGFSEDELNDIGFNNCLKLFPTFKNVLCNATLFCSVLRKSLTKLSMSFALRHIMVFVLPGIFSEVKS